MAWAGCPFVSPNSVKALMQRGYKNTVLRALCRRQQVLVNRSKLMALTNSPLLDCGLSVHGCVHSSLTLIECLLYWHY